MKRLLSFLANRRGSSAAEFALVLPIALLFLLGIIDVGRYAWAINEYEKATQMGARFAVVTDVVPEDLLTKTYVGDTTCNADGLQAGDSISCKEALNTITCNADGCECADGAGECLADGYDPDAFAAIVNRMRIFAPRIADSNVTIDYSGSGIGFAGDPQKPEIAPIVTVRLEDLTYSPITLSPIGGTVPLPNFRYSLTLEDGEGTQSS